MIEKIKESIVNVQPPIFKELPIRHKGKGALLGFADVHSGKEFKSLTNEYNMDILKDRMELLLNKTIEICKKENISYLNILNSSDCVEGIIRISQLMSLQMGLTDSTIWFARMMVEWLNKLSEYVEIIYHHVPTSNHSEIRPLGTQAGQFPKENMERIIIAYIHDMLQNNKRINVPIYENDYAKFEICGYKIMAKHKVKNIKSAIKDSTMLYREFIDYFIAGHYHHGEELTLHEGKTNNCEVILLPSIMGSDSYSDDLMTGSKAGAKFLIFSKEFGKEIVYDIILN